MMTDEDKFPRWESEPVEMRPQQLEYKYIMYDEHGKTIWEEGDNRTVDLRSIQGSSIIIEDKGWGKLSEAKVEVIKQ